MVQLYRSIWLFFAYLNKLKYSARKKMLFHNLREQQTFYYDCANAINATYLYKYILQTTSNDSCKIAVVFVQKDKPKQPQCLTQVFVVSLRTIVWSNFVICRNNTQMHDTFVCDSIMRLTIIKSRYCSVATTAKHSPLKYNNYVNP